MQASKAGPAVVIALVLGPAAALCGATGTQDLRLVADGKPVFSIVVPNGADAFAQKAAALLASTVRKASGAELAVVEEKNAPAGPKVYIGRTRAAEKAGVAFPAG
jgi:hypothetical protein